MANLLEILVPYVGAATYQQMFRILMFYSYVGELIKSPEEFIQESHQVLEIFRVSLLQLFIRVQIIPELSTEMTSL